MGDGEGAGQKIIEKLRDSKNNLPFPVIPQK
jgi:hypothetical protein